MSLISSSKDLSLHKYASNTVTILVLHNIKNISDQEAFIKAKILEANMLIDRVKDTLTDIKNKSKRDSNDYKDKDMNTVTDADNIPQICYEPHASIDILESARPKTRRTTTSNKMADVEDKFKTTLCDNFEDAKLEAVDSFELLQAKLNTIIEQAESESGSEVRNKDEEKIMEPPVEKVSTGVNTKEISVPQQSSAVQVKPDITSTGIQSTSTEKKTMSIQTEKPQKKFCMETNCTIKILPVTPSLHQSKNLSIQHMPPIIIKRKLVVQNVLKFYIDNKSRSHYIPQSKARNTRYFEINHTNYHTNYQNFKIKFDKDREERIRSISSDMSSLPINTAHFKAPGKKYCGSASDGELIAIRKNQLKVHNQPKVQDNMDDSSMELVLKSFHIYDNPNFHDPGDPELPLKISSIDTCVYKTYINPNGLPTGAFVSNNRTANILTPETLQRISQHKPVNVRNHSVSEKKVSTSFPRKNEKKSLNTVENVTFSRPPPKKNEKINLFDLGLYSTKSTQVETASFRSSKSSTREKSKDYPVALPIKTPQSVSEMDISESFNTNTNFGDIRDSDVSYERVSVTVSYSTEETVSSESISKESEGNRPSYIQQNERELQIVEPLPQTKPLTVISRGSQETFHILKEKFAKEGYKDDHLCDETSFQSASVESTVPEFISGLTESTAHDLRKIIPHIRRNVTGSIAEKSRNNTDRSDTSFFKKDSSKKCDDINNENKLKKNSKLKPPKEDYTVLSVQVHGDCIPNSSTLIDSHLKLGKNGRYKDEENLFCDNFPKLTNLALRRRALKNIPRYSHVNKHTMDSSSCDTVSVDPSLSEGEVKCHSSLSIGEVHRRPQQDQFSKFRQKVTLKNQGPEAGVIRERRTYFNHWITYYINKNASIPLLSHSSSTSST